MAGIWSATKCFGALVLGLALTGSARADLMVTLNSTSAPTTSGNGTIQFTLSDSGFVTTGAGKGETGLGSPATMDLSTITLISSAPGTATIVFSMNNISAPTGVGTIAETITGHFIAGSGSISYTTYGDNANGLHNSNPGGPNSGTVNTLPGSSSGAFTASNPYSLTEVLTVTFNGSGMLSLSSDSSAQFTANVPEPASIALALSAVAGMGGYGWKRRRKLA